MKRRKFITTSSIAATAAGFLPGTILASGLRKNNIPGSNEETYTLFYQPSKLWKDRSQRFSAWSHSITVKDGQLVNAVSIRQFDTNRNIVSPLGLAIAVSDDGVHWREIIDHTCPLEMGLAGYCVRWTGKEFVYFSSERNQGNDRKEYPVVLRQYSSADLKNWQFMGDEYTTRPEEQWYRVRWDELVILEEAGLFYGYITSEPRPEFATDSMGMLKSTDGVKWEVLPPPQFEWRDLPRQHMEVCFCEKIGGKYYLGMGSRAYMGHLGFSVLTFVSDKPTGPFRPDKEALRLCGNTTRDTNWLAKTFHLKEEILLSNWITTTLDKSFPGIFGNGQSIWIGPLKKLVTGTDGHLRIAWWPGNDAARESEVQPDIQNAIFEHPSPAYRKELSAVAYQNSSSILLKAGHDGTIAMIPTKFDFNNGILLEGNLKAIEPHGHITTHWHPAAAGFFFEEGKGKGMLVQMETLGLTRIGMFEYKPEPAFDAFEYSIASWGNTGRGGSYFGLSRFVQEDVIGPIGYAPPCGVTKNIPHKFRLLVKRGMFEIYIDDLYVQTYITGEASGRLGLFAKSGTIEFNDLKIWAMTPDSMGK